MARVPRLIHQCQEIHCWTGWDGVGWRWVELPGPEVCCHRLSGAGVGCRSLKEVVKEVGNEVVQDLGKDGAGGWEGGWEGGGAGGGAGGGKEGEKEGGEGGGEGGGEAGGTRGREQVEGRRGAGRAKSGKLSATICFQCFS